MDFLRTPDERFAGLADYPFSSYYLEVGRDEAPGLRMHFVDEGPREADPILMLHGEPSWSYLYRHMIPPCVKASHRVIAPDLVGFGKSDKPTRVGDYTYQRHLDWVRNLVEQLDLENITLVCQDWGSLIGLRLAAEENERFKAIVVGNGFLPTGDQPMPGAFKVWRAFALYSPWFPVGRIVDLGSGRKLSRDERRAYDAPFPSSHFKAGARAFPALVPTTPDDPATPANRAAWKVLEQWEKPFLTTFSSGDPITRGGDDYLRERIPGAAGQPCTTLRGGHFLQEDSPKEFATAVTQLLASVGSSVS